jgi:uncharacterized membrane protein
MYELMIAISVVTLGFVAVTAKIAYSAYQSAKKEGKDEGVIMLGPIPLTFESEGDVVAIAAVLIIVMFAVYYIFFIG